MRALVNGRPAELVDVFDRGLQYGDGLFETIAVRAGRPRLLEWHLERLRAGTERLGLPAPDAELLSREIGQAAGPGRSVVKLLWTRGPGARGYRPPERVQATRIVSGHPWPEWEPGRWTEGVRLRWCRTRLGRNPALAGLKHLNRLEQVLARAEWKEGEVAEGLMMDDLGQVIGGTQANLFAELDGRLVTPALDECGVAGVMRRAFLEWATGAGLDVEVRRLPASELARAGGLLLTNALIGAWPACALDGRPLAPCRWAAPFNAWLESR